MGRKKRGVKNLHFPGNKADIAGPEITFTSAKYNRDYRRQT